MTIINRFCPEVTDILAIRIDCTDCKSAITFQAATWTPESLQCPNCKVKLISGSIDNMSDELQALDNFAAGIRQLFKNGNGYRFTLRLEFDQLK